MYFCFLAKMQALFSHAVGLICLGNVVVWRNRSYVFFVRSFGCALFYFGGNVV